jgi:PAS domain S-box-containing protein
MRGVTGYRITEEIYSGGNSLILRARRLADDLPVILKVPAQEFPSPERIAWFKREFEVLRSLDLPGVVAAYGLEQDRQRPVMVLEDFGGESLHRLRLAGRLDLADALGLAIAIAGLLGQVHQRFVMHKDINPSNIVLNPATGQVKLIDFGISTMLSRETPTFRSPRVLEGTLAYISPEQTGRMNRDMDYRTDFYSFGVTLYELLTGAPPFSGADALELVHSHIARLPPPPHALRPDLPPAVGAIVMKLLAKNAEDRYQSAYGIAADLEECLRQWRAGGRVEPFVLGQHDGSDRFQIPQRLYGREAEIAALLAAFERASRGASELLLVAGYAGVGKSALVHELYKPMTARRGYFIAGKFDQLQRNIPYSALIRAFQSLVQQLLTESEASVAAWRAALLHALGASAQVIVDVIPEAALGPSEAQFRLRLLFQNFIKVFARPEHPLVIFLDDLQWADGASLQLIESLLTAADSANMLLLGAFRDNEVSAGHPLMLALDELARAGVRVGQLALPPLELPHATALVADTLRLPPEQVEPLAALVQRKTEGNPFFMGEFLKSLYVGGLLTYVYPGGGARGGRWEWDIAQIQGRGITDNVVELLAGKVQALPARAQRVVSLAACIGDQFDLAMLAVVSEQAPGAAAEDLWPAIAEGLVVPLSDSYKLAGALLRGTQLWELGEGVRYRFAHDRVQQAVYSLIAPGERHAIHWQIGQLMLRSTPPDKREEQIFALVAQLNHGVELLASDAERDELAALNLVAARRAKLSAAYQTAFAHARVGSALLGAQGWQRRYGLALDLWSEAAETAFLSGDDGAARRAAEAVLRHAASLYDKLRVYEVLIRAYRALDSVQVAFDVLRQLGITFPAQPSAADIRRGQADIQEALAGRSITDLATLPPMSDPTLLATIRIMSISSLDVYAAAPEIFPLYVFSQVALSIRHGNAPQSPYCYALYGLTLCGRLNDLDAGYQWGQLGLRLLDTLDAGALRAKAMVIAQVFINHWKEHARDTLPLGRAAYQIGLETGDLEFAGHATVGYSSYAYRSGLDLAPLEQEIAAYAEAMASLKQSTSLQRLRIYQQAILNLLGKAEDVCELRGTAFDAQTSLPQLLERRDGTAAFAVYINQLILCSMFGNHAAALRNAELADELVGMVVAQMVVAVFYFYDSLARLAVYAESGEDERAGLLARVGENQARMAHWAAHAPMNYSHKWHLVEAERGRVLGRAGDAREHYDQAAALAEQHGYVNEAALAYELAGNFYLARGQDQYAQLCIQNAHYAYQRWGALAKVRDIEERHPQLFGQAQPAARRASTGGVSTAGQTTVRNLDFTSVVKATQAISGEIVLPQLLQTLMRIVIENAGARRGCLLLEKGDAFAVVATGTVDDANTVVLDSAPRAAAAAGDPDDLPLSIVSYVARTHESVVLHDAAAEGPFTNDPYIARARPQSVLCAPILNGGRLTGMLYLENSLASGVFTPDRLEVLQILAAQTAISIENAGLYAGLEQSERKYRTLFEDSRDTIFMSGPSGEILDINPAGVALFGYSKAELLRMNTTDFYASPDDRRRLLALIIAEGQVRDFEAALRIADGSTIDGVVTATVRYADDGTVAGFQGIIRDVTERRRLDRERIQLLALQRELDVARHIQASMLPPAQVAWPGLDAVCYNAPAREVGGDFYAYRAQPAADGQRFAFALGDVTGKGVPAALLMAISMASFQAIVPQGGGPGDLLRQLDQTIGGFTRASRQNCALVYVDIELAPGKRGPGAAALRVANAGCVAPLIRRADGSTEWVDVGGLPLGTELGARLGYATSERSLASGDVVVLSSDGVVEARNAEGELFGFERLEQVVAEGPAGGAAALLEHLRAAVDAFAADGEPHDDVTIVVVRV